MPKASAFASVELDVQPGRSRFDGPPTNETPFRILLIGDFSGRATRGAVESLADRRPVAIDRDNFETVLERLGAGLNLPAEREGPGLALRFRCLDDFHPDRIYANQELFQALRALRARLEDPETFHAAAKELAPPPPPPRQPPAEILSGSLLDQMVDATETRGATAGRSVDPLQAYVRKIVAPHLAPGADPRQKELLQKTDEAISAQMRLVLHHPLVQALEAAWRGLFHLVREVETGAMLKIFLLDASKAEIVADLASAGDLRRTSLYRLLVESTVQTPGAEPWSLLAGNFTFRPALDEVELLARLGMIARQARAPFLAAAHAEVLGCRSLAETPDPHDWRTGNPVWEELRGYPEAEWIGLALPRVLLRLPYGAATDAAEFFEFEEMPGRPVHDDYLWGNPAFFCAALIAQSFSESGWRMRPGEFQDIHRLPLHTYKEDGETKIQPCAEVLLTVKAAERMIDAGLMPMLTMKNTDTVRVGMFQSIMNGGKALAGRWQR